MLDRESVDLIRYFLRAYPGRSALIVFLLILSGFAEGFGVVTLFPLLELAVGDGGGADSRLMQLFADGLGAVGLRPTIGVLLALIVAGMAMKGAFLWLAMRHVGYTVAHVATDLRLMLLRALLTARWSFFVNQPAGHIANAVGNEAHRASNAYRAACAVLAGAIQVLVYAVVAALISWQVAIVAVVVGGFAAGLLAVFVRMARGAGREQTTLMKSLAGRLTDAIHGIKPIKAMAREAHLWPLLEKETHGLNDAQERQVLASETLKAFQEPLLVLLLALGLYGMLTWGNQPFTALMVIAFVFYRLVGRVHHLQGQYQNMAVSESAFWSLKGSVELAQSHREEQDGGQSPPALEREIRFQDVRFSYVPTEEVLKGVSLTIPAGSFVAVIGPSGSGKTTLADLLVGLYSPSAGTVSVDGVDLRAIDKVAWRSKIGYVPQEMFLFHDTIRSNITLGDDSITSSDVEEALRMAGAGDFVRRLPDGLDTVAGERGSMLSGGQRQRISLARALVRKPRLLILDEVTTALDPATEAEICHTLGDLKDRVSVLAISHQPAIVGVSDLVYRIEHGRVIEESRSPASRAAIS